MNFCVIQATAMLLLVPTHRAAAAGRPLVGDDKRLYERGEITWADMRSDTDAVLDRSVSCAELVAKSTQTTTCFGCYVQASLHLSFSGSAGVEVPYRWRDIKLLTRLQIQTRRTTMTECSFIQLIQSDTSAHGLIVVKEITHTHTLPNLPYRFV